MNHIQKSQKNRFLYRDFLGVLFDPRKPEIATRKVDSFRSLPNWPSLIFRCSDNSKWLFAAFKYSDQDAAPVHRTQCTAFVFHFTFQAIFTSKYLHTDIDPNKAHHITQYGFNTEYIKNSTMKHEKCVEHHLYQPYCDMS